MGLIAKDLASVDWSATAAWIALFGSAALWADRIIRGRKNIDFSVIDYHSTRHVRQFYVMCSNMSSNPNSITSVYLSDGKTETICKLEPTDVKRVIKKSGAEITSIDRTMTATFPISLQPHEAKNFYLEYIDCPDIELSPGKAVCFRIGTIHGRIIKHVTLGNESHYLRIKK